MASFNKQINIERLPTLEDVNYHPLEKRYQNSLYTFWVLSSLILLAAPTILILIKPFDIPTFIYLIVIGLILVRTVYSFLKIWRGFPFKGYAIREKDILYKTGWLWKTFIITPFNRVQHLSIDQGPIDRKFQISKLRIFTAGGSGSDLSIPGLDPETAQRLKAFIVEKTALDEEE